jgi:hypothetical protein
MFYYNINKIIDILQELSYGTTFRPPCCTMYKSWVFAFGFNKALMAGELSMIKYKFQILYH